MNNGYGMVENVKLKDVKFLNSQGDESKEGFIIGDIWDNIPNRHDTAIQINKYFTSLYGNRVISPVIYNSIGLFDGDKFENGKITLSYDTTLSIIAGILSRHWEFIDMAKKLGGENFNSITFKLIENATNPINVTTKITENTNDENKTTEKGDSKDSKYGFDSTEAVPDSTNENNSTTDETMTHSRDYNEVRNGNDGHDGAQYLRNYISLVMSNPLTQRYMGILGNELTCDLYMDEDDE